MARFQIGERVMRTWPGQSMWLEVGIVKRETEKLVFVATIYVDHDGVSLTSYATRRWPKASVHPMDDATFDIYLQMLKTEREFNARIDAIQVEKLRAMTPYLTRIAAATTKEPAGVF